ncbi:SIMPL domain-containing protein [Polycyclovorans algicola]|uniref:SIMPL domain-containing protein n=1 Tax=Polycyclovorans algicola TaxID=616992 RepID=UPI0004A6BB5B|nr:SIMPL domain-containing protein [Polycyclovorans algicola]
MRSISHIIIAVVLAAAAVVASTQIADGLRQFRSSDRNVTVKGLAEREVAANLVIWPVNFGEADNSLEALYNRLEAHTAAVRAYLQRQQVSDAEVSVGLPRVQDMQADAYGGNMARPFRYRGELTLTVRSAEVPLMKTAIQNAGELVRDGVVFGAYNEPPQFIFTELNALKPELLADATANARLAAEQFAADSGSEVGAIRDANQGVISINDRDAATPDIKVVRLVSTVVYQLR